MERGDMDTTFAWTLLACAVLVGIVFVATRVPAHRAGVTGSPAVSTTATKRSNQVDFRAAEKVVLAYTAARGSSDATATAALMTSTRRGETLTPKWRAANAWWKAMRVKTVSRPGRYFSDERALARRYTQRFGHGPYKLIVLNVAYSQVASSPAGSVDFVVTKDAAKAPWLVDDYGGGRFAH